MGKRIEKQFICFILIILILSLRGCGYNKSEENFEIGSVSDYFKTNDYFKYDNEQIRNTVEQYKIIKDHNKKRWKGNVGEIAVSPREYVAVSFNNLSIDIYIDDKYAYSLSIKDDGQIDIRFTEDNHLLVEIARGLMIVEFDEDGNVIEIYEYSEDNYYKNLNGQSMSYKNCKYVVEENLIYYSAYKITEDGSKIIYDSGIKNLFFPLIIVIVIVIIFYLTRKFHFTYFKSFHNKR